MNFELNSVPIVWQLLTGGEKKSLQKKKKKNFCFIEAKEKKKT